MVNMSPPRAAQFSTMCLSRVCATPRPRTLSLAWMAINSHGAVTRGVPHSRYTLKGAVGLGDEYSQSLVVCEERGHRALQHLERARRADPVSRLVETR